MRLKKNPLILTIVIIGLIATSCSPANTSKNPGKNVNDVTDPLELSANIDFESLTQAAKGSTVTFYGWGGDEDRNRWLNQTVAPILKDKYDITLEYVGMDIENILSKLAGEKQAGQTEGTIDMIWINGENFYSAKDNGLLYGPFVDQLPNYDKYLDKDDIENRFDFGFPIDGFEAPYSKAQLVLIKDSAITEESPSDHHELLEFARKYKGRLTYAALPDFTGSAFVRTLIYDIVGYEQFMDMEPDKDKVKEAIEPALEYLRELNPYLWNQGQTFPSSTGEVNNMFEDGELVMTMSYDPYSTALKIDKGLYADTVESFIFRNGMVGNTNYIAIANNSPNKAAAMVAINEIISAELQATQFEELKALPVVSYDKLNQEEKERFDKIDIGEGVLSQDELQNRRLPEMPANIVPIIEQIWLEEVVGNY